MSRKLEIGELFADKYRILELIGQGGYGAVYRACQENIPRDVALKVMLPESSDDNQIKRFRREAQHISQLKHPNTITLFDFGYDEANAIYYIVMELLDGRSLADVVDNDGALAPERAHRICSQILRSLNEAHARGLVHRDLKPENIFIVDMPGEEDFIKVLDFGIARGNEEKDERLTVQGTVVGTPWYMAPEQATGREVTAATDVYAVGLLLYEMLTGRQAFQGDTAYAVLNKHVTEPIKTLPGTLAGSLYNRLIQIACAKKQAHRFPDAGAFLKALMRPEPPRTQTIAPIAAGDVVGSAPKVPFDGATEVFAPLAHPGNPSAAPSSSSPRPAASPPSTPRPNAATAASPSSPRPAAPPRPNVSPSPSPAVLDTVAAPVLPSPLPPAPRRWGDAGADTAVVATPSSQSQDPLYGPPPFVDRSDELDTLRSLVNYVVETRALHMVLVDGEIGIGKTRLWRELQKELDPRADLTAVTALHHEGGPPLGALRQLMLALISPELDEDEALLVQTEQFVYQHSVGTLGNFLPAFFNPKLPTPHASVLDMGAAETLWHILEQLLRAAAERAPLILCLDDMQWTDELTVHFIHHLSGRLQLDAAPIGLVMMIRPGVVFGQPDATEALHHIGRSVGDRFFNLHLAPLPPAGFQAFVRSITAVDEPVLDALWSLSAGNPWFASETLRFACRSGALRWSDDRWLGDPDVSALKPPPTLIARAEMALEPLIPSQPESEAMFWAILQWVALLGDGATHTTLRTAIRRDPRGLSVRLFEELFEGLVRAGIVPQVAESREPRFGLAPHWLTAIILEILAGESYNREIQEYADQLRGRPS